VLQPLCWRCAECAVQCARRTTPIYKWREQAIIEWSWRVISVVACCHCTKFCALAAQAFRSQHLIAKCSIKSCNLKLSHPEVLTFCELLYKKCWRWQYVLQVANDLSVNGNWSFGTSGLEWLTVSEGWLCDPVAYAETFHGGRFIKRHRVVICICCALFVTSQNDVIVLFPSQRFGEVCWHNMHIFLYIHSSYYMCQCTEYKLLELQVRVSEENTYTQRYHTAVRNCKKYQAAR